MEAAPADTRKRPGYALKTIVRRMLLLRMAGVTLATAVLVAGITYVTLRNLLEQEAADRARSQVAQLLARTRAILATTPQEPQAAFRQALTELAEARAEQQSTYFVYARFRDLQGGLIAEAADSSYLRLAAVEAELAQAPAPVPRTDEVRTRPVRLEGHPHVVVVVPVVNREGLVIAYGEGVFTVSEQAVADFRWRLARNVLVAVAIVFITAALLYPIILRLTRRLTEFSTALLDANLETLSLLGSAIAKRDGDTDAHNYRVTLYAVRLAEACGLASTEIQTLIKGAFLHDVGKIGIRDEVLLKPGHLSEDEYRLMKTHVNHGLDIIHRSHWLADAASVVGAHHEKYGGSGYPHGVQAEAIPVAARIFAIADVFDALTSRRPYKDPLSFEAAMELLEEGRGTHFDPQLLDAFRRIAPDLYRQYAGAEADSLRPRLDEILVSYFAAGVKALRY